MSEDETARDIRDVCVVLNEADNVAIARRTLTAGTVILFGDERVALPRDVPVGHKLARMPIAAGQPVLRWGFPIGSATTDIALGDHVHLHNMKSDYIPTFVAGEFVAGTKEGRR